MTNTEAAAATSSTSHEPKPARRGAVIVFSVLAGFALTVLWSAPFVDKVIGDGVTSAILGHEPADAPMTGILAGVAFAFASGLGGTFTACNIAALGAVAPMLGQERSVRGRFTQTLPPLGWLVAGMTAVSAVYGVIAGLFGTHMPQYSTATVSSGLAPRLVQSMVVFGVIGLVLCYLGLAALKIVKDPLEGASRRFPHVRSLVMGLLIGAFLIGRPFGLYRQLFRDVADSGNPLYGAFAFVVQSLGNIVVLAVIFLLLAVASGGRVQRWITAKPGRAAVITASAFLVAGVFTFLYWDVRLLARTGVIWYPTITWY
ncbi:hypothetical protein Ppa06_39330 [Planomonospora parontospora subsp. parontospora]|uniref:Cytochrome C biogenesis protein transmembrane region n=2 Tax=Planomonospora parontospora TaxID=58119 RepID=A0AA37BIJ3_9ACTN|nr:hypothetical protein [Planomonospora parontospora]GGK76407.1 hypothetical protein GCM10010126_39580 [Planomonospora parontospora]GII10135.1 hypothetical protein Ppa06_39330 [Planomonospora parontospora subsp. parontospora]